MRSVAWVGEVENRRPVRIIRGRPNSKRRGVVLGTVGEVVLIVATALGAAGTAVSAGVAVLQHRGRRAEGERADRAEEARDRMAEQLSGAREELARSSAAHERLADIELEAAGAERRAARDSLRLQKKQAREADKAAGKALSEQKKQARKDERARKRQDDKMLAEQKKQRRAAERAALRKK